MLLMLKKAACRWLALALVLTFFVSDSAAQTRINFKRGRTSATLSGTIGANGSKQYVVRAKANQTIALKVASTSGDVTVSTRAHSPGTMIDYQLEQNGDVNIFVENNGAATKFTLTVAIR